MKFRSAKLHAEPNSWSVILNPLRSELDKKRIGEKIAELFSVSYEEARELVQNTPLILLDRLTHSEAIQLQGVLQTVRADATLTDDQLAKRRCFRAIWPQPPNVSFLNRPAAVEPSDTVRAPVVEEEPPVQTAVQTVTEPPNDSERKELEKKYRALEFLYEERTHENQELRHQIEEEARRHTAKAEEDRRALEEEWEERYEGMKMEAQESKAIYEEKILSQEREMEGLKERVREMDRWREKVETLEKQNQDSFRRLNELESAKEELDRVAKERSEEVNLWREKYHVLAQKSERYESLYEGERKRREQLDASVQQTSELVERTRRDLEVQVAETERWRKKFQELEESQKRLEQEFSRISAERESEIRELRDANRNSEVQLDSAQRQTRELLQRVEEQQVVEKRMRLANELALKEARVRELVLGMERIRQEIQDRELQAQSLATEQANLEREILEVKQAQRHLLEQSKMKEKTTHKLKRPTAEGAPGRVNPALTGREQGEWMEP